MMPCVKSNLNSNGLKDFEMIRCQKCLSEIFCAIISISLKRWLFKRNVSTVSQTFTIPLSLANQA